MRGEGEGGGLFVCEAQAIHCLYLRLESHKLLSSQLGSRRFLLCLDDRARQYYGESVGKAR